MHKGQDQVNFVEVYFTMKPELWNNREKNLLQNRLIEKTLDSWSHLPEGNDASISAGRWALGFGFCWPH